MSSILPFSPSRTCSGSLLPVGMQAEVFRWDSRSLGIALGHMELPYPRLWPWGLVGQGLVDGETQRLSPLVSSWEKPEDTAQLLAGLSEASVTTAWQPLSFCQSAFLPTLWAAPHHWSLLYPYWFVSLICPYRKWCVNISSMLPFLAPCFFCNCCSITLVNWLMYTYIIYQLI